MEQRASYETRFFSSRYRSNPFRPPDVLGVSNRNFDHVSEQADTFQTIQVNKVRNLITFTLRCPTGNISKLTNLGRTKGKVAFNEAAIILWLY